MKDRATPRIEPSIHETNFLRAEGNDDRCHRWLTADSGLGWSDRMKEICVPVSFPFFTRRC
jgi:hypothetical protein